MHLGDHPTKLPWAVFPRREVIHDQESLIGPVNFRYPYSSLIECCQAHCFCVKKPARGLWIFLNNPLVYSPNRTCDTVRYSLGTAIVGKVGGGQSLLPEGASHVFCR